MIFCIKRTETTYKSHHQVSLDLNAVFFSQQSLVNPCELHCRPVNEHFSEKMLEAVTDGTPCFMNNKSRNICVNGVCKVVWLGKRCVIMTEVWEVGGLEWIKKKEHP